MGSDSLLENIPVTALRADAMRPLPSDPSELPRRDPELDVFFPPELLVDDVFRPEPADFDLVAPPFAELPLDEPVLDPPLFDVDVLDDPDLVPAADLEPVEREAVEDFDVPVRDDPADFDAVVFLAPEPADEELFADFDEEVPDLDPAEDFVAPDFELDLEPPELELRDLDAVDFDVEDFLVVGICCFLRLLESRNRIRSSTEQTTFHSHRIHKSVTSPTVLVLNRCA